MDQNSRLKRILDSIPGRRVLVVGDMMVDEYVWGRVRRISPEAPVMVVEVDRESSTAGGAANVVNNVQALGGVSSIIGVVGDDDAGRSLCALLSEEGADVSGVVTDPSRPTIRKTRVIAHSQQVVRVDRESRKSLSHAAVRRVISNLADKMASCDIVVFSDYNKGLAVSPITQAVLQLAGKQDKRVVVNPKPPNVKRFKTAFLVSLNQSEVEAAGGVGISCERDLRMAAKRLLSPRYCGAEHILVTRGPDGMSLFASDGGQVNVPAHPVEVYDVAGAGDTVVSVLSLALAAGADMTGAAVLANCAGGCAVRKVGVATVSRSEIAAMLAE